MDIKSGNIAKETGRTARSFFSIMREQPLALALAIMNIILLCFLFYSGSSQLAQRKETVGLIVEWQRETDRLLASCVSREIMETVVNALERDRELYRLILTPKLPQP
jgi:hypothetical protein